MLRSHSNPYVSKNKVVLVVVSVLLFTLIDWVTEPPEVSSIEGAALDGVTAELAARAQAVERTLAQLVRELGEIDDGDAPLTALGGVKARFEEQRGRVERGVEEAEETLHGMLEANHKQLEEWVASLPDGCQDGGGGGGGGAAAKKRPMPDHPLGGQDEVIEVDIPNVKDDGVANAMRAKEEEDRCSSMGNSDERAACQRKAVVAEFQHSWKAYKEHAWGHDEVKPLSKTFANWGRGAQGSGAEAGMGLTMFDALTTMHIMGLEDEFDEVRHWVKTEMRTDLNVYASTFEYTIRVVGGLLSAYELSGEKHPELLAKAKEVADRLLPAYDTPTGIPHAMVNLASGEHRNPSWTAGASILSEFATVQLELRTLSYHTKDSFYDEKATWINDVIDGRAPEDYLCPTHMSTLNGMWTTQHVTVGALGDSYYEYLLKQYLLTGNSERRYRLQYEKASRGIVEKLVRKSYPSGQAYVAELKNREDPSTVVNKMDHLACFTGGMLALGAHKLGHPTIQNGLTNDKLIETAEELASTCYLMYTQQATGIAPEVTLFNGGQDMQASQKTPYYLLRPEAIETWMYLYRVTKQEKYREWGWNVFKSIRRWCKVADGGYSGLKSVLEVPPKFDDLQQSFWFAETLKYLYLLFSDDDTVNLDAWVFNTEGHPFKIRKRNPQDVWPDAVAKRRNKVLMKHIEQQLEGYPAMAAQRAKEREEEKAERKRESRRKSSDGPGGRSQPSKRKDVESDSLDGSDSYSDSSDRD